MRLTVGSSSYTIANFQADLADLDAAIASGVASRQLAATRELRSMLGSAALTADMRAQVLQRVKNLAPAQNSAVIT